MAALELAAFPQPWNRAQLASELALASSLGLLARDADGVLAGYVLFRRILDEAELLRLAVSRERRRRGLATALVERGLADLRAAGCTTAFLEVRADNAPAIAFYERGGWRFAGRRSRYYPDGIDALLYRRAVVEP
ncbi:MAG TPA: ribosomal protein S18-alanine N-acetyltransferase [Thermoanaerobaculia bacterium]|jgi:ribosomal-protein-alanine N-acetyltransferase|nr:ribosomal protein S18-alanine N-acetyltransferase [Thermoanaerobaculia bacterium]